VRTEVTTASPGSTRSYAAQVRLASGHVAALGIAPAAGRVEETIELVGADYGIAVDIGRCGVTIHRADRVELAWQADPGAEEWERNGTLDETRAFLGCLAGRRDWWPTLEDGLWSARVAAAVERGGEAAVDG
jgi:hypothetical protein